MNKSYVTLIFLFLTIFIVGCGSSNDNNLNQTSSTIISSSTTIIQSSSTTLNIPTTTIAPEIVDSLGDDIIQNNSLDVGELY